MDETKESQGVHMSEADTGGHAFDQVSLTTPRLLLRPFREADAEALFAIFSDPQVMRYMNRGPPHATLAVTTPQPAT
jgi:RimJ/RimL family protein N-acetyltransferase